MTAPEAQSALRAGNALLADGNLRDAVQTFRRAIACDARLGDAHYNLGIALRRSGDWREAVLAFRCAARLNPADFDAMQNVVSTLGRAIADGSEPFSGNDTPRVDHSRESVSIVVCSIDPERLARMQASFAAALPGVEYEFVVIRDAESLAQGYARGLGACRHEIVVFAHDDVELAPDRALSCLAGALGHCDVVGVAGSRSVHGPAVNWDGHPHVHGWVAYPGADPTGWDATLYSLESGLLHGMQALDGLLFAVRRETARRIGFDAATFDGFHFYDLDFTYRAWRLGLRLAVSTELVVFHASAGDFGAEWNRYAQRFRAKFPELDSPAGPHHSYGVRLPSRRHVARFYDALRGLAEVP